MLEPVNLTNPSTKVSPKEKLNMQPSYKIKVPMETISVKSKQLERKEDIRRKILIGSYYLEKATLDNQLDKLNKLMDNYLTRDSDRKLFKLTLKSDS